MARLRGRKEIMIYLSLSPLSNGSWQRARLRYGTAIRKETNGRGIWTDSIWLDAIDIGQSRPICKTCQGGCDAPLMPPHGGPSPP